MLLIDSTPHTHSHHLLNSTAGAFVSSVWFQNVICQYEESSAMHSPSLLLCFLTFHIRRGIRKTYQEIEDRNSAKILQVPYGIPANM